MSDPDDAQSRVETNRMAVAAAVGSLLVALALALLYWTGLLAALVPEHGPAADAVPLYVLLAVVFLALVVWGWQRFLSLLK